MKFSGTTEFPLSVVTYGSYPNPASEIPVPPGPPAAAFGKLA